MEDNEINGIKIGKQTFFKISISAGENINPPPKSCWTNSVMSYATITNRMIFISQQYSYWWENQ